MTPTEFKNLLDKYARGECSREEQNFIAEWYEKIGNEEANHLTDPNHNTIGSKLWLKVKPSASRNARSFHRVRKLAAAIVLLVVAGAVFLLSYPILFKNKNALTDNQVNINSSRMESVINTKNLPIEISLSDGSQIILQPESEVVYSKNFLSDTREVYLSGEAFFNVKRDTLRPFLVYANEVITEVLGTSFNVKAYEDEKEVTVAVKTGKVSVYSRNNKNTSENNSEKEIILVPNQKAVYYREKQAVTKKLVEKPEIILPKPTLFEMQYDGASVAKIFKVLEENFGIDIEFDEDILSNCILTTSMTDEGFYERIEIICKAIEAEYEIRDAVVLIKSEGCR